jgi:hypothetical protein
MLTITFSSFSILAFQHISKWDSDSACFWLLLSPSFAACWERIKPFFSGHESERRLFAELRRSYTSADMRTVKNRNCTSWRFPRLFHTHFPFSSCHINPEECAAVGVTHKPTHYSCRLGCPLRVRILLNGDNSSTSSHSVSCSSQAWASEAARTETLKACSCIQCEV